MILSISTEDEFFSYWRAAVFIDGVLRSRKDPFSGWLQSFFPYGIRGGKHFRNDDVNGWQVEILRTVTQEEHPKENDSWLKNMPNGISEVLFSFTDMVTRQVWNMEFAGGLVAIVKVDGALVVKTGKAVLQNCKFSNNE
jgi:hypothetical protein